MTRSGAGGPLAAQTRLDAGWTGRDDGHAEHQGQHDPQRPRCHAFARICGPAQPTRTISLLPGSCQLIPGHQDNGPDYASCKLPRAVTDVAIVLILMGCEVQVLGTERPVVLPGYDQNGMNTLDR